MSTSNTYYVKCASQEERDSLLDYAVKRGAKENVNRYPAQKYAVINELMEVYAAGSTLDGDIELTPDSFRRKVRKLWPSPTPKPKPSPKARKPSQLDRIEAELKRNASDHGGMWGELTIISAKLDTILASLSQPTVEQAAPQPESLRPGDYTDASKETADALTAMGWGWLNAYQGYDYIRLSTCTVGELTNSSARYYKPNHLTPAEFLRRAAVTAKELRLVPVVEEPWVPKVGEWVVVTGTHSHADEIGVKVGDILQVEELDQMRDVWFKIGSRSVCMTPHKRLRPATDAEVQQHLAEQEAKANAEKMAKLKAMKPGTPIKVKGKKQCTFIALERECLVWYAHYEDESYYAALTGASDITVIEQP